MTKRVLRPLVASVLLAVSASTAVAASFTDPTATISVPANVKINDLVYIGPFANIMSTKAVKIGRLSDIQDSVTLQATLGPINLGEKVILAHGATVTSKSSLGETGICPNGTVSCPSFVGFNAVVDGAIIEKDAMVGHLAKVAPGVRIPSGRKVLPGKYVQNQKQVDAKTALVTEADRAFMDGVIHVNESFALNYPILQAQDASNVHGINYDPAGSEFNLERNLPTLAGVATQLPEFRNRIIGDVRLADGLATLDQVMKTGISLRADEGDLFEVGSIAAMEANTTFHALEHNHLHMGHAGHYGYRSIVHGGPTDFNVAEPHLTSTGANFNLGAYAVFFRSQAGDNVQVGAKSLVQQCDLVAGTVVPSNTIRVCGAPDTKVEW